LHSDAYFTFSILFFFFYFLHLPKAGTRCSVFPCRKPNIFLSSVEIIRLYIVYYASGCVTVESVTCQKFHFAKCVAIACAAYVEADAWVLGSVSLLFPSISIFNCLLLISYPFTPHFCFCASYFLMIIHTSVHLPPLFFANAEGRFSRPLYQISQMSTSDQVSAMLISSASTTVLLY